MTRPLNPQLASDNHLSHRFQSVGDSVTASTSSCFLKDAIALSPMSALGVRESRNLREQAGGRWGGHCQCHHKGMFITKILHLYTAKRILLGGIYWAPNSSRLEAEYVHSFIINPSQGCIRKYIPIG